MVSGGISAPLEGKEDSKYVGVRVTGQGVRVGRSRETGALHTDLQLRGPWKRQTLGARPLVVGGGSKASPGWSFKTGQSQGAPLC